MAKPTPYHGRVELNLIRPMYGVGMVMTCIILSPVVYIQEQAGSTARL